MNGITANATQAAIKKLNEIQAKIMDISISHEEPENQDVDCSISLSEISLPNMFSSIWKSFGYEVGGSKFRVKRRSEQRGTNPDFERTG